MYPKESLTFIIIFCILHFLEKRYENLKKEIVATFTTNVSFSYRA